MGKKLEKGLKEKNPSAVSQDEENPNKTPEPYNCTGNFQADFSELCRRSNMTYVPPIIPRARPPTVMGHTESGKPDKGKGKAPQAPVEPEPDPEQDLEDGAEAPPKTFTMKDKFEYFKPSIQVEMENFDKPDTVTEIYIRGWKITEPFMEIFKQCWSVMEKLHSINLWNCGLSGEVISMLASTITNVQNLRSLVLDGNTVKEENWHELMGEESPVQNLSLRHCGITDKGAEQLGQALGSAKRSNTKLISLNLSGNRITDVGAEHIALGLRMNRNLMSLSLASNHIEDKGASKIAEILSRFPLTHEEVVERRKHFSEKDFPERNKSPPGSRRDGSKDRPASVRSQSHMDKDKKGNKASAKKKDPKGKDSKEEEKHDKTKKKEKDDKAPTKKDDLYGKFTFSSPVYEVLESKGILEIDVLFHRKIPVKTSGGLQIMGIMRNGQTVILKDDAIDHKFKDVTVEYETREGSAKAGSKFKYTSGTLEFKETEYKRTISIPIIQDNQYTGNADFYIVLKNPSNGAGVGDPSVSRINIVDDDAPGEFQFSDGHVFAKDGKIVVKIMREMGYDGKVTLEYSTHDVTAVGGDNIKDFDYVSVHSTIEFKNQEKTKNIDFKINKEVKFDEGQGSKSFIVTIKNPSVGAKIGKTATIVCHINKESLDDRIADVVADIEEEEEITWGGQFYNAFTIGGEKDEEGNDIKPKWHEFLLHFLTFFWKVVGACIPPTKYLGAWPAFVLSLVYIGVLTTFIQQLAGLLGCVIGMETSVTGITLIALGTSLPDTFASRTAAKQDEHADAAIGNITGSNSVNVFLGLGLPWVLATMYGLATDKPYKVATGNLTLSVIIFSILAVICVFILILRRKLVGGELGGKNPIVKWLTSFMLFMLWVVYIILASLRAYNVITW